MKYLKVVLACLVILTFALVTFSGDEPAYIGVNKCKMCHKGKKKGEQYELWLKRGHSKAYETLKNEQSAKIAKKMGIKDPVTDPKCTECHITADKVVKVKGKDFNLKEEGVSCEACHGPGSKYKSPKIMSKAKYKKDPEGQHKKALAAGLIEPNKELCLKCHNKKSPTYKKFVFKEAVKKVTHPIPR